MGRTRNHPSPLALPPPPLLLDQTHPQRGTKSILGLILLCPVCNDNMQALRNHIWPAATLNQHVHHAHVENKHKQTAAAHTHKEEGCCLNVNVMMLEVSFGYKNSRLRYHLPHSRCPFIAGIVTILHLAVCVKVTDVGADAWFSVSKGGKASLRCSDNCSVMSLCEKGLCVREASECVSAYMYSCACASVFM